MLCLHLFDTYNYAGKFQPLLFLFHRPLTIYFGQVSDFCVMGFAFCSGYAHYQSYAGMDLNQYYSRRLKALVSLYLNFEVILILFTIVSILTGHGDTMPGSLESFLGNATSIHLAYNGAWWYLFTFLLLVAVSPVTLYLMKRYNSLLVLAVSGVLYCVAYYVRFEVSDKSWFGYQFGLFGMTLFEYYLGAFCSRHRKINKADVEKSNNTVKNIIFIIVFLLLMGARTIVVPNIIFAPVSGMVIIFMVWAMDKPEWVKRCLHFVSDHTTNIWLTHMFFYAVLFKGLVYRAKYPIIIYLFMFLLTITTSLIINAIYRPLDQIMKRKLS